MPGGCTQAHAIWIQQAYSDLIWGGLSPCSTYCTSWYEPLASASMFCVGFDHPSAIMKDSFVVRCDLDLFRVCDVHLGMHLELGPAARHVLSLRLSSLETR